MENFLLFSLTSILLILTPGPGNILAMARGLSQGKLAACISAFASGFGVMVHVVAATLELTALLLTSSMAFTAVKIIGAIYLIFLGVQAIRKQSIVTFTKAKKVSSRSIAISGFLTAALSPKIGIFILAYIPQFISPQSTSVCWEMALLEPGLP